MKPTYLLIGLLALYAAGAGAIELNTDAMKKMQEEGDKILDQELGKRSFKSSSGLCMQVSGSKLSSGKCHDKAGNQKWYFDDKSRLVSFDGNCVSSDKKAGARAVLQKCGGSSAQKWQLDSSKRLVNGANLCLQDNGGTLVAAECDNSPQQKWN